MSLVCPRCAVENRDGAKRCMACNQELAPPPAARPPEASPAVAPPRPASPRLCPAGRHPMDPAWAICPYCEAERKAKKELEPPAHAPGVAREIPMSPRVAAPPPPLPPPSPPVVRRATELIAASALSAPSSALPGSAPLPGPPAAPRSASPRRATVFGTVAPEDPTVRNLDSTILGVGVAPPPATVAGRRIVAVLVTYTWRPEGQVFPLREGRNIVGRDPSNEVVLDLDTHLSGRHATILFRGKDFWIDDEKSMNGTFVDGVSVEEKQKLRNYARIRTGTTEWSFIRLDAGE